MKKFAVSLRRALALALALALTLTLAWAQAGPLMAVNLSPDAYVGGHPANPNYYNPQVNHFSRSAPACDPDYYYRKLSLDGNRQRPEEAAPPGPGLGRGNPYYDRYGDRK